MTIRLGMYFIFLCLTLSLKLWNGKRLLRMRDRIGRIIVKWPSALRPVSVKAILRIFSLVFLFASAAYWLIRLPAQNYGHINLLIGLFLLVIFIRTDCIIAEGGAMFHMHVIKWQELKSWDLIQQNNHAVLMLKFGTPPFEYQIPIPDGYQEDLLLLFSKLGLDQRKMKF